MRHWMQRLMQQGTGHDFALWPVLLLLLIVLVPSAGIVWMMRTAMDSERLAARQRLAEAYAAQLEIARRDDRRRLARHARTRRRKSPTTKPPAEAFAEMRARPGIDSVVILRRRRKCCLSRLRRLSDTADDQLRRRMARRRAIGIRR